MKKARHIIIHLFLLGMLCTVFQYLPVLEEEVPGHTTELTKKVKETDGSNDNDGEDGDASDDDDGTLSDLFFTGIHHYSFEELSGAVQYANSPLIKNLSSSVIIPPPKV